MHRDVDVLTVRIDLGATPEDLERTFNECIGQIDGGARRIVIAGKGLREPRERIAAFLSRLVAEVEPRGVTVSVPAPGNP
ncbi:MAG: hypothetical protein ABJC60_08625 [Actinomycetota bacterium]